MSAQAISEPDERYAAYCASSDFIREHIFPGGHLPSMGAMVDAAKGTGLFVQVNTDQHSLSACPHTDCAPAPWMLQGA